MTRTSKEEVAYWDEILDSYENELGLSTYTRDSVPEQELQEYLTMTRDTIEYIHILCSYCYEARAVCFSYSKNAK